MQQEKRITLIGGTPGAKPVRRRATYFIAVLNQRGRIRAVKIGHATYGEKSVQRRIKTLQTGSRDTLKLLGWVEGSLEKRLHREFAGWRLRGEFFKPCPTLLKLIEQLTQVRVVVLPAKLDSQGLVF